MKRAALVNKRPEKRSRTVEIGDEDSALLGFDRRVLLSLVVDVTELRRTTERLQVQVFTLAKVHGIVPPELDD